MLEGRENRRLGSLRTRKKHKKLDAICENVYNLNHRSVKAEDNADGDETELRRSTRVRRAPVVLDASPLPAKKRRRVEYRSESGSVGKGKRREGVNTKSGNMEGVSGVWGDRLRARAKKGKRQKRGSFPRRKTRFFKVEDGDSSDDAELESSIPTVVKSKRPRRIKASNVLKNINQERESSSDEAQSSETNEGEEDTEEDEAEDDKIKGEASDHEENDEGDEGHSGESDEDGEDPEENEDVDEGETSGSNEDVEVIGEHIGKKEAADCEENDEAEMGHSSESNEDGEDAEENEVEYEKGKSVVGVDEENDEVDAPEDKRKEDVVDNKDEDDVVEHKESDKVIEKASVEENLLLFNGDVEFNGDDATKVAEKAVDEVVVTLQSEDRSSGDNLQSMEPDVQVELPNSISERESNRDSLTAGISTDQTDVGRSIGKPLDDENVKKSLGDTNETRYLRVGRRCGLCGTGTGGKPPKKYVEDGTGSDQEVAYSGSSASEDVRYDSCDGFDEEPGWLGRLLGPINDRYGIAGIWVHQHCAVWSPEVYFAGLGCLKNVRAALCRGRVLKCTRCSRPGATIGCRVDRCPKTYHLPCARANGCIFDHRKFLIACTDHRHLFQPHGVEYLHKVKKMKAKKLKLEMRKVSSDAWRKDLEAEEKYLENCGEDEEFLKRESKRLHRDLLRIAPVYIGGSNSGNESQFQGWESVAGLQNVIQSLKEVVILPLLYPEFFSNMGLTPPRGVLLHGYPGTGKTLVVRALIGSCSRGDKRIAYFARKGADCLGKYVGDAERQLRLLFHVAEKSQPSIIFFDEIDGLAPRRTRRQDQTHNSVVSTLLALMDGLKSRGSVVVIGATNRPDSVDPALRRPGRFDREIYFPLPSAEDREAILSLHTRKWPKPVAGSLRKQLAINTVGFAGADLQSLCTQAAITALRRSCPFQEILSAAEKKGPLGKHPPLPSFVVEERDWLEALRHAPPPCSQRGTEMAANDVVSSPLHAHLIPCLLRPLSFLLACLCRDTRILLPSRLYKAVMLVKSVIASGLNWKQIPRHNWWSRVHDMLLEVDVLRDVEIKLSRCGIVNGQTSDSSSDIGDEDANGNKIEFHCPKVRQISTRPSLLQNVTCGSEKNLGFWLLISGSPRSGQRYLASCLLHCFVGNLEIQKLDSATITQEGQGDFMQGVTRILMKCASVGSSLIFMPRIDMWAVDMYQQHDEGESGSSVKNSKLPCQEEPEVLEAATSVAISLKSSLIWNIFVEQVEAISVSSSLIILATSELPFEALPDGIRQFFKGGKSHSRSSSPSEETIPRFSVHLDGHFNRDSVLNSSVTELSKDLVQQFIQLTHMRVHVHWNPCADFESCDTLESSSDNLRQANEVEEAQFPENSFMQFQSPPNSKTSKGKSNLLLTIATLGYQILRYPHFAELCWATSKLKEGPYASTRGPWKGWPFNSCIIRPDKSSEQVAVAGSSSSMKSRENYGFVRGLIAVGLSAYQGKYTMVREVSAEVRKVLELLADEINAKIRSGKDPYHYTHLLSQMAYFEDVVNSWAYSLQSLEEDAEAMIAPTSNLTDLKSGDNMPTDDIVELKNGGEPDVSAKISGDTTEQKVGCEPAKSSDAVLEKCTQNFDLNEPMEEDDQNPKGKIIADEPLEHVLFSHLIPDSNEQHGNNPGPCTLETPGKHPSDNGVCLSAIPNGFANTKAVFIDEDGPHSGDMGIENSSIFGDASNEHNEKTMENNISCGNGKSSSIDGQNNVPSNSSAGKDNCLPKDSSVICFYHCCSECLIKLHTTIWKIFTYKWGLRDNGGFTVEDVHDLFASVSMNLHSSLRKMFIAEWGKCGEEVKRDTITGMSGDQEIDIYRCKDSQDGPTRPKECMCHSTTTSSQNSQHGNDLKFVCRNGVVSLLDPEEVTSPNFHCKFETICLCSLIEWIEMTKQSSG